MKIRKRTLGIIVAIFLAISTKHVAACDFPPKALLQKPRSEYHGLYTNETYDYSVVIPDKLVGYDNPDPANHEGFGLVIGQSPQGYILVQGEFGEDEPIDRANRLLRYALQRGKRIESATIKPSHLGGLNAAFLLATYTCPGSAERYVQASTVALSPDKGIVFEVTLYSLASRYNSDRAVLDQILRSWKYIGR